MLFQSREQGNCEYQGHVGGRILKKQQQQQQQSSLHILDINLMYNVQKSIKKVGCFKIMLVLFEYILGHTM